MCSKYEICCFDSQLIGTRVECDRFRCERKHTAFNLFHHPQNKESFYCLNRKQLGEYWQYVVNDWHAFCPEHCDKCDVCNLMTVVYTEL